MTTETQWTILTDQPTAPNLLTCPDLCAGWTGSYSWLLACHQLGLYYHIDVWTFCPYCGLRLITERDRLNGRE